MLNTAVIIGVERRLFEEELKLVIQENFDAKNFQTHDEAFEVTLDYFFTHFEELHRSDSNHNSCLVIKNIEEKNKLSPKDIDINKQEFNDFISQCKNFPSYGNKISKNISKAFLNLAEKLNFEDVKLFIMNYA